MTNIESDTRDHHVPEQESAERARNESPVRTGPTDEAQGVFDDQRDVDPQAVPAVEMLRTVVTLGCATLDESLVGQALPASAVIRPHGVELTICHAGALELALPAVAARESEAPAANTDTVSLDEYRELVWLFGPARLPRAAFVGRALHELGAVTEERAQSHAQVCTRIQRKGPGQLRPQIVQALAAVGTASDSSKPVRALTNLLKSAIKSLGALGWLALRPMPRGGSYLQGKGIEVFDGFPAWSRQETETPAFVRPGRRRGATTNTTMDDPDDPDETPRSEAVS
jgi:hypothetical protein